MDVDAHEDVFENQVRFEETDMQGIVFYGNYATYQDETVSEFMRQIGYGYGQAQERGWDIHVVNVELNYRGQATFDDWLVNGLRVDRIGGSSLEFSYVCRKRETGEVVTDGDVTHVVVDEDGAPMQVPEAFREAVVEFQDVPPAEY